jgi:hypothetical protein
VRAGSDALATSFACVAEIDLPDGAHSERVVGAVTGEIDSLTLPPSAAASTLYVLEHLDDHSWPVPSSTSTCRPPLCAVALRTRGTQPRVLFDVDQLSDAPPDNPVARGSHVDPLTVWVPNGSRGAAAAGGYELDVESKLPGRVQITAITRAAQGERLDLNLYYVGVEDAPVVRDALERVDEIFAPAGIFLGDVRHVPVPGALPERGTPLPEAEVSAGFRELISQYHVLPELPELLRLSAGAANAALDVFFVATIDDASGGADVGGMSGGTPSAFGMHGTTGSGIVIAAQKLIDAGDAAQLGHNLAHELGHALGLFHTTELDGLVYEPLDDTPACPIARDQDGSGTLSATECAADGGDNLMFPTSDAGSQLTAEQARVLHAALILQ